jgi:aspartyl/asparaginyl beta-hydroxylase (cupin superfamily)
VSTAPQSNDLEALLERGDSYARGGDPKAAMSFYQAALQLARSGRQVDPRRVPDLQRAQAYIRDQAQQLHDALDTALDAIRPDDAVDQLRLTHALEMLSGTRTIYPQQPNVLYYPYLAQRQFFEREEFDWVPELEAATPAILAELLALVKSNADFRPYVEDDADRPARDFHGLNNDPSWSALYLYKNGALVEENAARCPNTMAALDKVPLSRIGARTPAVLFSRLEPGAHIPPHSGMLNSRLICHLPLIVPTGCWLRVGNETREWEEGKLLIFDDSIEHEAKNPSGELRIILLFDIWRPELGAAEREGISAIFETIDRFQTLPDA